MGKILDWLCDIFEDVEVVHVPDTPEVEKVSKFEPSTFDEYIGQHDVKYYIQRMIEGCLSNDLNFPHVLLVGKAGYGKTTLARIIAQELGLYFLEYIASSLKDGYEIMELIEECDGGVLFLDEIHAMDRSSAETLYTIMESFVYNGVPVKPFTLIGATTEYGDIIKKAKPFAERFLTIELDNYTIEDLSLIATQYAEHEFKDLDLNNDDLILMAKNCRSIPRRVIQMTKTLALFNGDYSAVLKGNKILVDGYTKTDYKLLKYLNDACNSGIKTVGLQAISSYLEVAKNTYMYEIEPYLMQNNLITRTARGRAITQKGLVLLERIESFIGR